MVCIDLKPQPNHFMANLDLTKVVRSINPGKKLQCFLRRKVVINQLSVFPGLSKKKLEQFHLQVISKSAYLFMVEQIFLLLWIPVGSVTSNSCDLLVIRYVTFTFRMTLDYHSLKTSLT